MPNKETPPPTKKSSKLADAYQYSAMAFQMGITIGLCAFLGLKLDEWLQTKVLFTLILSLSGVFMALYHFIKKAMSDS